MEEIIATHTVKPSSPTPLELKTHTFSIIDQLNAQVYIPFIFFYQNHQSQPHTQISLRLRQSLSEILTIFYPLAGKLNGNSSIDCNDSGAEMVEARIHAPMDEFTQDPNIDELTQLLPTTSSFLHEDDRLLSVKINFFDCGGVAVGINFSHKVGDLSSLAMFMKSWSAAYRGEASQIISPSFDLALHFPPMDIPNISGITNEKIVTRRLVFNSEKLQKIKKQFASEKVKDPSTVEPLSAFIWQTAIQVHKAKSSSSLSSTVSLIHSVNMRPRTIPPIPDHAIGNCAVQVLAMVSPEDDERERKREKGLYISKIRDALRGVDNEYIKNVVGDTEKYLRVLGQIQNAFQAEKCVISSWWRFPMYDVDFGWGKPVWVCTTTIPYSDVVNLMSTPSGDGIEAWINSLDDDFYMMLQANCTNLQLD